MFDLPQFLDFTKSLLIDSKEVGRIYLGTKLYDGQKYLLNQIDKGIKEGIHTYVVLKGRQEGISTIMWALDLYWGFANPGTQATLVVDKDENRDLMRGTITTWLKHLPPQWSIPVVKHNRTEVAFRNRSRMSYQVAGVRKGGNLSRGQAINYGHFTETGSWVDPEGLASLQASLAETNPRRLYVYESTAKGYNMFKDLWDTAKASHGQKALFIAWWLKNTYRIAPDKQPRLWKAYGKAQPNMQERAWIREVKALYKYDIDGQQMAWYRWKLAEEIRDEIMMNQEYPCTEQQAFVATGTNYFDLKALNDMLKASRLLTPEPWQFHFGQKFADIQMREGNLKNCELKIWQWPVEGGWYTIGVDPAYGYSPDNDHHCVQVMRCYADGLEQVAEFCSGSLSTHQLAWVAVYLAGAYSGRAGRCMMNLEVTGPGQAVLNEILAMRRYSELAGGLPKAWQDVAGYIRSYLSRRLDNPRPGGGFIHSKSTHDYKERMMGSLADCVSKRIIDIRSEEAIREAQNIVRDEGIIKTPQKKRDDRVIAIALATLAWHEQMRVYCAADQATRAKAHVVEAHESPMVFDTQLRQYLRSVGALQ